MSVPTLERQQKQALRRVKIEAIGNISLSELETMVSKWMLLEDPGIVKLICAAVIANKLPASPTWLFLVAPSGGGKTDLIRALNDIEDIYPLSTLTPQTFLSGMRGEDASLLPQIDKKIITFKDFTTILQSHPQAQAEIFAQLREIYDGYYKKDFGTGGRKEWEGKIGFIAGVTSIIDRHHNVHKSLGERFLQYRIEQPDRMEVMGRIEKNALRKEEMEEELSCAFAAHIKNIEIPEAMPTIDPKVNARLKEVSNFVSISRSAVIRNHYSNEIEFVPDVEMSTRIYNQIYVVAIALSIINKDHSLTEADFRILFKLGFDSIHYLKKKVLNILRKYRGWVKTDTVALQIAYSTKTTRQYLEDLVVLGIAEKRKPKGTFIWRLKPDWRESWKRCEWTPSSEDSISTDEKAEDVSLQEDTPESEADELDAYFDHEESH